MQAARTCGLATAPIGTKRANAMLRALMIFMTRIGANPPDRDSYSSSTRPDAGASC